MAQTISQRELRNDSSEVLRAVQNGAEFVVTRNGMPVAELRPLRDSFFVTTADLLRQVRQLPTIDARRFRDDLDGVVSQDLVP